MLLTAVFLAAPLCLFAAALVRSDSRDCAHQQTAWDEGKATGRACRWKKSLPLENIAEKANTRVPFPRSGLRCIGKKVSVRARCALFSANKARKGKSFEKPPLCRSRRQQAAWTVARWCIFGSKTAKNQLFCPGKNEKSILMAPGRVGIVKMAHMHLTRRKYVCPTDGRDHG